MTFLPPENNALMSLLDVVADPAKSKARLADLQKLQSETYAAVEDMKARQAELDKTHAAITAANADNQKKIDLLKGELEERKKALAAQIDQHRKDFDYTSDVQNKKHKELTDREASVSEREKVVALKEADVAKREAAVSKAEEEAKAKHADLTQRFTAIQQIVKG